MADKQGRDSRQRHRKRRAAERVAPATLRRLAIHPVLLNAVPIDARHLNARLRAGPHAEQSVLRIGIVPPIHRARLGVIVSAALMALDQPVHIQLQCFAILLAIVQGQGRGAQAVTVGENIVLDRQRIQRGQHALHRFFVNVDSVIVDGQAALGQGIDAQRIEAPMHATRAGTPRVTGELMGLRIESAQQPARAILNRHPNPLIVDGLRFRHLFRHMQKGNDRQDSGTRGRRKQSGDPRGNRISHVRR